MDEIQWRRVAREAEVAEGKPYLAQAGEEKVLLVRVDGVIRAMAHECPHYHEQLVKGVLIEHELICPSHGARFDVRTGKVTAAPSLDDLGTYPVKIEAGEVFVGALAKARFPKAAGTDGRTFLIVGAGAAGSAAAETLRREGFAGRIVMVTPEADRPYDRPNLSKDLLTGEAKPEWMPLRGAKFYPNQSIELLTGRRVTAIDPASRSARLDDGSTVSFDAALLATGASPRRPAIPGSSSAGCLLLRSWEDGRRLQEALLTANSAVVVGGGFIGLELASSLRKLGKAATVVMRDHLPLARTFGERVAAFIKRRQEELGVSFVTGAEPTAVSEGTGPKVLTLSNGSRIEADLVVFGVGVDPVVDYLQAPGLVQDGAVPVDATLATRAQGIFAAGDIAAVAGLAKGQPRRIEHWVVAQRQGQHAARAMLGSRAPYEETPFFWTRQCGFSLKYVGHARSFDEVAVRGDVEAGRFLAGYFQAGTLVAASTVGRAGELVSVECILRRGLPVSAAQFADEGFDLLALARSAPASRG